MQAYARAELTPLASEFRLAPVRSIAKAAQVSAGDGGTEQSVRTTSSGSVLASLILESLDGDDLAALAGRLLPYLRRADVPEVGRGSIAYTVASLSAEIGLSQKAIRCAISRRELPAVKRGSRWIISADAVHGWATASGVRRSTTRTGCAAPKAAGPSLRSVLCGGTSPGGAR